VFATSDTILPEIGRSLYFTSAEVVGGLGDRVICSDAPPLIVRSVRTTETKDTDASSQTSRRQR